MGLIFAHRKSYLTFSIQFNVMKKLVLVLLLIVVVGAACKRRLECVAGFGGALTLVVYPQHNGSSVYSRDAYRDTAFIKFNTLTAPPDSVFYDLIVFGNAGENHVNVPNLKCGNYYVHVTGYDTVTQQRVTGSFPVNTTQQTGEQNVVVPVNQ
jgi:hypothetical protein